MDKFVVISGCSGGGKSTLLDELARRGYATVEEPGRRIVMDEIAIGGAALPWVDPVAFAKRAIEVAAADRLVAPTDDWVFFDRGLVDAAAALQHVAGGSALEMLHEPMLYHRRVFLTPPWPKIFRGDNERRHGIEEAVAEYERLLSAYPFLGYEVCQLPKVDVSKRAEFVLATLGIN